MRIILLFLFIITISSAALAEDKLSIIATVGDEAITNKDLLNRLKIMIMSSGGQGDPETVSRLKPQALRELIDEKMYIAEAKKLKYNISKKQITAAIETLEQQNNMPKGGLLGMLSANKVPAEAMDEKLSAEISYAFLVAREVTPKIKISDDELTDFIKAETQVTTRDEFFIQEIVLPINLPEDDAKMLTLARDLKEKIKAGADFAAIAKANSKSPSFSNGGNVGWLDEKQIPQEIMAIIRQQGAGKVLGPIKSVEGYYLIIAKEKRTITSANDNDFVELRQFSKMPKAQTEIAPITAKVSGLNNVAEACLRPDAYAKTNAIDLKNHGRVRIGDLPSGVRNLLSTLGIAQFSKPITIPTGITTFLVCERAKGDTTTITDAQKEKAREIRRRESRQTDRRRVFLQSIRSRYRPLVGIVCGLAKRGPLRRRSLQTSRRALPPPPQHPAHLVRKPRWLQGTWASCPRVHPLGSLDPGTPARSRRRVPESLRRV